MRPVRLPDDERYDFLEVFEDLVSEDIYYLIEAGLYAASGRNNQKTVIVAVTNRELRDRLSALNQEIGGFPEGMDPFYGAPAVLIVLDDKNWPTNTYDGSLVMGNLMLAAHSLGLGSCWIHRAKEEFEMPEYQALLKELGVEGEYVGIGHCILGYPDCEYPEAPDRLPDRVYWCR